MDDFLKLNAKEHRLYFKTSDCADLSVCQALCCKKWDIHLAHEEAQQGIFKKEALCAVDKSRCTHPKQPCPHRSYRLIKNKDGSCVYLDTQNRCTIYSSRPIVCRNFICDNGFTITPVCAPREDADIDAQICSFEGGLNLKMKYLANPYLKLKHFSKMKNSLRLEFRDITSCKTKKTDLIAMPFFKTQKETVKFLNYFDGRSTLSAISKKTSKDIGKGDFQNLILYLIDEGILVGMCGK